MVISYHFMKATLFYNYISSAFDNMGGVAYDPAQCARTHRIHYGSGMLVFRALLSPVPLLLKSAIFVAFWIELLENTAGESRREQVRSSCEAVVPKRTLITQLVVMLCMNTLSSLLYPLSITRAIVQLS